jgi:DNA-binding response OmpR family regulator/predicted regulator of Ras-like GTPase activity (Roadblock/LC7/MglB family)
MSDQWRILVVEDDEHLNQSIVNTLSIDGYAVKGTASGAAAIRLLWTEEYDVIIGDLKTPGADGLQLLQWLRTYRPNTRMIMLAAASGSPTSRTQALEAGAVSYLEKPLQIHELKEELRRLLQQTGFSANLDSFDLLDVIQIITMSRKSIALLVNTGLEERGVLYFQNGELIWAEYGILRGEEAFFALAAHKSGTVIQQPWYDRITPNVRLPLSRLILQALHYRTKYASLPPSSTGEHAVVSPIALQSLDGVIDDSPFQVLTEVQPESAAIAATPTNVVEVTAQDLKEWWQQTGKFPANGNGHQHNSELSNQVSEEVGAAAPIENSPTSNVDASLSSPSRQNAQDGKRSDLPSWVTEHPVKSDMPMLRPSSLSNTTQVPSVPPGKAKLSPAEWQTPEPYLRSTDPLPRKRISGTKNTMPRLAETGTYEEKRNYSTLVAALQTVGYSITGFIAAAVASLDGQPIAQVAIHDLDIAPMCKHFSQVLRGTRGSFQNQHWEAFEHIIISSAERHVLLRLVGKEKQAFHVLITTHDADPSVSLEIMANVEAAIAAALY